MGYEWERRPKLWERFWFQSLLIIGAALTAVLLIGKAII
jgi:hypothetical protein